MGVEVERVDFEIEPVENEGLDESQHRFPKESIQAEFGAALVQNPQYAGSEDQSDESSRPLNPMLNIRRWVELKDLFRPSHIPARKIPTWPLENNHEDLTEDIERHSRPDKSLPRVTIDVDTPDPQRGRYDV